MIKCPKCKAYDVWGLVDHECPPEYRCYRLDLDILLEAPMLVRAHEPRTAAALAMKAWCEGDWVLAPEDYSDREVVVVCPLGNETRWLVHCEHNPTYIAKPFV